MRRTPFRGANGGFTLVEIAVVLVIAALVLAFAIGTAAGILNRQKYSVTSTRLAAIDVAVVQFVLQQKRLPCPADGTMDSSNASAGLEMARTAGAGCTTQTSGVVPWRVLGLTEADITDGWGRRMTYRAHALSAADGGMNMAWCDPAGTEPIGSYAGFCNTGCVPATLTLCTPPSSFLANKGLQVRNIAGTVLMNPADTPPTGAAFLVISHGESGGGAYLTSGSLQTSTTTDGTEEGKNYANLAVQAYYVDDSISDVPGATHFDDLVLRPVVLNVINRAGLGPRPHQ
jgi:prepilin-type N-terminal cleavage/methylation domain-containing protein